MPLTEINPGDEADAEVLMSNFDSLQSDITAVSNTIATTYSGLETQITNLTTVVNGNYSTLDHKIDTTAENVIEVIDSYGFFVETSFDTTTGEWSREFFSDSEKTQRVWLECGGTYTSDATVNRTVINNYKLVPNKQFTNDLYYFIRSVQIVADTGDLSNRYVMYNSKNYEYISGREAEGKLRYITLDIAPYANSHYFTWYACGV